MNIPREREPYVAATHSDFDELLRYCPSEGSLWWRERRAKYFSSDRACEVWNTLWSGKRIGTLDSKGYLSVRIGGRLIRLHRIIYFMVNGVWPCVSIDHINGVKTDNRWVNLRHATRCQNQRNQKRPKTNTSGHKGVIFDKANRSWYFQMRRDDGSRFTKSGFPTKESAAIACRAMREKLHGQYANHG